MRRGFTLIELLVVVAIIAILAGLLMPALVGVWRSARVSEAQQRIAVVEQAVTCYERDRNAHPPGDGRGSFDLLRALAGAGPRQAPYYVPHPEEITTAGDLGNPVHGADAPEPRNAIHYRRNGAALPGQPPVRRGIAFDLWCAGPDADASRPESAWSIRGR